MTYDRDLGWGRRMLWVLAALTLGSAYFDAREHHWLTALTGVIWTVNLLVLLSAGRSMQRTRDEVRLIHAGIDEVRLIQARIDSMREEIEDQT